MAIETILAHLSCGKLASSIPWFTQLFGRAPDATPMPGLAEWHQQGGAGLQLFEAPDHAGHGTLTLVVSGLEAERERLLGLSPGEVEQADYVNIVRMRDPDGNLVVLAEPR